MNVWEVLVGCTHFCAPVGPGPGALEKPRTLGLLILHARGGFGEAQGHAALEPRR